MSPPWVADVPWAQMLSHPVTRSVSLAALAVASGAVISDLLTTGDRSILEITLGAALGVEIFLGILAFSGAALAPEGTWERLGLRPGRLSAAQTLLLIAGTLGASMALDGLLDLTTLKESSALGEFEEHIAGVRGRTLWLSALAFGVAPGLAEELLCRGLLQRGLVRRLGAPAGILVASVVFGALHVEPVHAVFAAPLGLYLGIVSYLAGGIRGSIACHTANNLVALGTGAFFPELDAGGLRAVGGGGVIALGALWWVWRRVGSPPHDARPISDC